MLAKAGESDRAIKVKMVRPFFIFTIYFMFLVLTFYYYHYSQNIFSLEREREERQTEDKRVNSTLLRTHYYYVRTYSFFVLHSCTSLCLFPSDLPTHLPTVFAYIRYILVVNYVKNVETNVESLFRKITLVQLVRFEILSEYLVLLGSEIGYTGEQTWGWGVSVNIYI